MPRVGPALSTSVVVVVLFGGNGGKLEGSYAGAFTLPPSIGGAREPCLVPPLDRVDTEDRAEKLEDIESEESRRLTWSDGLRGGNAGDGWAESLRGANRGGGTGFACSLCPVLVIVGGGNMPFCFGPLGSLPLPLLSGADAVAMPVVFLLPSSDGLSRKSSPHLVGVAEIGARPTWPTFNAAIRAWIDCGWELPSAIATNLATSKNQRLTLSKFEMQDEMEMMEQEKK